jgi:hypothetical protein
MNEASGGQLPGAFLSIQRASVFDDASTSAVFAARPLLAHE